MRSRKRKESKFLLTLSSDFDRAEFLREYWQKKPVVLRQLFPKFTDPLTPEELAGCACEDQVESRLVCEDDEGSFSLQHGPFNEKDFTSLPESHYTLLVQAMDQWFDEVTELKRAFDFVPSWRVDDVMISYASEHGGVGPHFDNYDVFLIQGMGRRRWRLGQSCDGNTPLKEGSPLRIIEDFKTTQDFVLEQGDVLYVPPGVAHWGEAVSKSLCYSLGFRAPSEGEMLEGFSDFLISRAGESRYEDPAPTLPKDLNEIEADSLTNSFARLKQQVDDVSLFQQWFGCHVTQPKYPELIVPLSGEQAEFAQHALEDAESLSHHPSSRFAFLEGSESDSLFLFADGQAAKFPLTLKEPLARLCEATPLNGETLDDFLAEPRLNELLLRLVKQGSLQID